MATSITKRKSHFANRCNPVYFQFLFVSFRGASGDEESAFYRLFRKKQIPPAAAGLGWQERNFFRSLLSMHIRGSGGIYRITIYLGYGGGDYHGGVPRFGGAALPHPQVRGRRGRGGARRGPRAAAVFAL